MLVYAPPQTLNDEFVELSIDHCIQFLSATVATRERLFRSSKETFQRIAERARHQRVG